MDQAAVSLRPFRADPWVPPTQGFARITLGYDPYGAARLVMIARDEANKDRQFAGDPGLDVPASPNREQD